MHKLSVRLPPFSPDYSGVCSALFELGGMAVIHDAAGCTGNYTGYDEPRWYGSQALVYCSALREIDAVLGTDDNLVAKIVAAAAELSPSFIALLGSPVPMVIGSDFTGIAMEIEERTGIPAFGFSTTGLRYYDQGASEAFLAIAKRFVTRVYKKRPHTINLFGATAIDFATSQNIKGFKQEFAARGFQVIASFAMDCSLETIGLSSVAAVNVVISASGLSLAEYFRQKFGTPYVIGQPMGKKYADKLCESLARAEQSGENVVYPVPEEPDAGQPGARILLIGEQVTMHSLRSCLFEDFGIGGADVGCPFLRINRLTAKQDFALPSEKSIKEAINCGKYSHIVADPLFQQICGPSLRFIPLPHVAVSSKVHWNEPPELAGEKIKTICKELFK